MAAGKRTHRWFEPYAWAIGGGFAIGVVHALVLQPTEEVFVTDSWGYVPKDDWWLHGLLIGISIAVVYAAVLVGFRLVAWLLSRNALFLVGGLILVAAGAVFLGRAAFGDEGIGGRIAWVVMGVFVGGLGVPMLIADRRAASERRDG